MMSEENQLIPMFKEQCEVIQSSFTETFHSYDIFLDENIREPSYYRQAFHTLRTAREGDRINILLNNGGGRLDTAISFRNLIQETQAEVLAVLEGDTHSAASIIALSCHGVHVKPYASMMIHHASFGTFNTVQNVMDHVNFTSSQTERLVRDVYKFFLSDQELDEVVRNREIWLSDEEIGERLDRMYEARRNEPCDCEHCQECGIQGDEGEPMPTLKDMIKEAIDEVLTERDKKAKLAEKKAAKKTEKAISEYLEKAE